MEHATEAELPAYIEAAAQFYWTEDGCGYATDCQADNWQQSTMLPEANSVETVPG